VHRISARAEKKVTTELVNAFKRVGGKENILFQVAEASLAVPDDPVRQVVFPAVASGEQTLRELVHEFKTKGPVYRRTVTELGIGRSSATVAVEVGVGAGDKVGAGLPGAELGDADGDRAKVGGTSEFCVEVGQAGTHGGVVCAGKDAEELVAAVAGDDVCGAQRTHQCVGDAGEEPVAGGVPTGVVDPFEPIDVDKPLR